ATGRAGVAVSGAAPPDQAGMDCGRRRNFREQSAGEVLPADNEGPKAIEGGNQQVGQTGRSDRADSPAGGVGEEPWGVGSGCWKSWTRIFASISSGRHRTTSSAV